ncbi:hypothetical protein D3C87_459920 [compost metagenome]
MNITRKQFVAEDNFEVELDPYVILQIPKLNLSDEQRIRMLDWAEKLESGKFQQTRGRLRKDIPVTGTVSEFSASYCCLGVACAISKMGEWGPREATNDVPHILESTYTTSVPSYEVCEYFGMDSVGGITVVIRNRPSTIMYKKLDGLNDNGASFGEIAKIIRLACADGYLNPEATPSELKRLKRDGI